MALCIGCSSGTHEWEDCPYRDAVRDMRAAGIDITYVQAREMDDAARD